MEYAILALLSIAVLLLIVIFVAFLVKNKKSNAGNEADLIELLKGQLQVLDCNIDDKNNKMLDEINRQFTSVNGTINGNYVHTQNLLDGFKENQTKAFEAFDKKVTDKIEKIQTDLSDNIAKQEVSNLKNYNDIKLSLTTGLNDIQKQVTDSFGNLNGENQKKLDEIRDTVINRLDKMKDDIIKNLNDQRAENFRNNEENKDLLNGKLNAIQTEIGTSLDKMRDENQTKLDAMRAVVDDKLQTTLNKRIDESFKAIGEQLQAVNKGLGEMTSLTNGVNNLNKIMSNVKTRGLWGEIALNNLLEQILTKEQYGEQVQIKGREMVDFAIYLPGKKDGEQVILPIDAKFPMADYENLVTASESFDKEKVLIARKNLIKRIKDEAKSISTKYINVPSTTNFAIMYLPIEGLFAEAVKENGLLDELQLKYKVVISGPTTLTALLNSLQLGFKTLQIQKNSSKVWQALSKFKTEFQRFSDTLDKVKKQASTVVTTLDDTSKKSKKIESHLNSLSSIECETMELNLIGEEDD